MTKGTYTTNTVGAPEDVYAHACTVTWGCTPAESTRTGLALPCGARDERREEGNRIQLGESEVEDKVDGLGLCEGEGELLGGGLENRGVRAMETYDDEVHNEIGYSP